MITAFDSSLATGGTSSAPYIVVDLAKPVCAKSHHLGAEPRSAAGIESVGDSGFQPGPPPRQAAIAASFRLWAPDTSPGALFILPATKR
jgi:hypothetical protein